MWLRELPEGVTDGDGVNTSLSGRHDVKVNVDILGRILEAVRAAGDSSVPGFFGGELSGNGPVDGIGFGSTTDPLGGGSAGQHTGGDDSLGVHDEGEWKV